MDTSMMQTISFLIIEFEFEYLDVVMLFSIDPDDVSLSYYLSVIDTFLKPPKEANLSDFFRIVVMTLDGIYNYPIFKKNSLKYMYKKLNEKDKLKFKRVIIKFFARDSYLKGLLIDRIKSHLANHDESNHAIFHFGFGQLKIQKKQSKLRIKMKFRESSTY